MRLLKIIIIPCLNQSFCVFSVVINYWYLTGKSGYFNNKINVWLGLTELLHSQSHTRHHEAQQLQALTLHKICIHYSLFNDFLLNLMTTASKKGSNTPSFRITRVQKLRLNTWRNTSLCIIFVIVKIFKISYIFWGVI